MESKIMDKKHLALGQLHHLLKSSRVDVRHLEMFLKNGSYDLNCQIPLDCLLAKRNPLFTGYSVLHFTVDYKFPDCYRLSNRYEVRRQQRDKAENAKDFVELLLSHGADFTLKTANGFTPLRLALEKKKDSERTKLSTKLEDLPELNPLLEAHVQSNNATNPTCNDGISHFHIACFVDNVPVARFFLEAGVSVNESVNETSELFPGFSPLHFAVRYGSENLVKLLLTYDPDLNLLDGNGMTPLCLLIGQIIETNDCILLGKSSYDKNEIEQEFLRNDTLVRLFINKYNDQILVDSSIGLTSFHVSCTMKDITLSERLLKSGADVSCKVNDGSPMWSGYTPAHFAAHCNRKIFKMLVENGADILAKDVKDVTPLDLLVERYRPTDVSDVLKLHPTLGRIQFDNGIKLVDAISAMEQSLDQSSDFYSLVRRVGVNSLPENSPLWAGYNFTHVAAAIDKVYYKFRHYSFVKKSHFTSKNYELSNDKDESASTSLCFEENLTVSFNNVEKMTPLHLAFHLGKRHKVDQILQNMVSSDVLENCIDRGGLSHLQIACIANNAELVKKFLKKGCNPESPLQSDLTWRPKSRNWRRLTTYKAGYKLCHIAAANGRWEFFGSIYDNKALFKMDMLSTDGLTALHVGFLTNGSIVDMLLLNTINDKTNYIAERAGGLSHLHIACNSNSDNLVSVKNFASVATNINAPIDCKSAVDPYAEKLASYDGWTPLHFAISSFSSLFYETKTKVINLLISKGADVSARTAAGMNALDLVLQSFCKYDMSSIRGMFGDKKKLNLIKLLYKKLKKKREWTNSFGLTRLHVACILDDEDEVKSLLEAGEDVNKQIDANSPILPGDTALHIASICSSNSIIKLLMKNGADPILRNAKNIASFHQLWNSTFTSDSRYTRMDLVSEVMKAADPQFYKVNFTDDDGLSHFHISCKIGNADIVNNFLDAGVDIDKPVCPFHRYYGGFTALHFAARHGKIKVVELLLQRGANWKLENSDGFTPIQEAVLGKSALLFSCSVVSVFFSNSQMNDQVVDIFGDTALKVLMSRSCKQYHESLLNKGVRINFVDPPADREDIATAAWELDNAVFRTLVERATDVTSIDPYGKNVVHCIGSFRSSKGIREVVHCALNVNVWLDKGCDLNLRDKKGRTPLHYAANTGASAPWLLILLGADVNIRDNEGQTALSYFEDILYDGRGRDCSDGMRELFLDHCLRMTCSGLYLDDSLVKILESEYGNKQRLKNDCKRDLTRMEQVRITEDLSLRDLLTEKVVKNFRHFHASKREIILQFLKTERLLANHEEWKDWNYLFQYQYRKILHRTKLMEPAKKFFYERICQLPLECIEMILRDLSNYDLERLIKV